MAKENDNILQEATRRGLQQPSGGQHVPEAYFEDFVSRMAASLPYRSEIEEATMPQKKRTIWEHVRPYVYMAAMFAGVWCMMQMFHSIKSQNDLVPFDSNPVLAKALESDAFLYDYVSDDLSAREIVDEMADDGMFSEDYGPEDLGQDILANDSSVILPQ